MLAHIKLTCVVVRKYTTGKLMIHVSVNSQNGQNNYRRENFRGKFPGNSGKFREIPGKFPTGKFPGKLSEKIPGKFIFSSAEFVKIREIG